MKMLQKHKIRSIVITSTWILAGCASVVLLAAGVHKTEERQCAGINIKITGVNNNFFIDKSDVLQIIDRYTGNTTKGKAIPNFDLRSMENVLKKEIWIKNAELFFDNNNTLQAIIEEREPVARIFTYTGSSFYIDSSLMMLPLSEKFSARIPVFTGFPSDTKVLAKRDSSLLKNIKDMAIHIQQDPFLMGLIDQVDITSQRSFELLPKIGNQLIVFGDASSYDKKFDKLKLFYKNIIVKSGFGRYNLINLQYDNQVVAGIRGKEDVIADSLRTKMLMQLIAEETERMASDSARAFLPDQEKNTDSTIVLQSIQRDETAEEQDAFVPLSSASTNTVTTATVIKAPTVKPSAVISTRVLKPKAAAKTEVAKPKKPVKPIVKSTEKKAVLKPTPKAVMQPKNEY